MNNVVGVTTLVMATTQASSEANWMMESKGSSLQLLIAKLETLDSAGSCKDWRSERECEIVSEEQF